MGSNPVFAVTVFFVLFRECLETTVVVSVLLAFLKQTLGGEEDKKTYKKLVKQVWLGCGLGVAICLAIGAGMIGAFYGLGTNAFSATEDIWEGVLGILASIIITIMGAALLRVSKLQEKWRLKLAKALEHEHSPNESRKGRFKRWTEKYVMFMLPFITVLREGLEAVIYVGGVGLGLPASSFPLAIFCGLLAGFVVGYVIYRGGRETSMQIFLIISTCFLYLVAGGLFSRGVWFFENNTWNHLVGSDTAEVGSDAGSYDIDSSVWHVNCCNPLINGGGGWGIFNALFGWTNSATLGSVLAYNFYWICVMVGYGLMMWRERNGPLPYLDPAAKKFTNAKGRAKAFFFRTAWDQPYSDEPPMAGPSRVSGANLEAGVLQTEKSAGAGVSPVTRHPSVSQ